MICRHCSEPIHADPNGAGGTVWCHDFGSTVCHDDPPGSHEDGDTTTCAEPRDHALLPARNGAMFGANLTVDTADGSLTIESNDGAGVRSAHRDHAQSHFAGHVLWCMNRLSFVGLDGARKHLTVWNTQAFRAMPAAEVLAMRREARIEPAR